jgi:hypothetical protein
MMQGLKYRNTIAVFAVTVAMAETVLANPAGVPVPETPPLSCTTSAFAIQAVAGPNGEFPKAADCGATPCAEYHYRISGTQNVDHTVFSVSATQDLHMTSPTASVAAPGAGDTATGFLAYAQHEYPIRFNTSNAKSTEARIYIKGESTARVGTVLVRSGTKRAESCLIATPGTSGEAVDTFQPIYVSQTMVVAGGKCVAELHFDQRGVLVDVTTNTPGCIAGSPEDGIVVVNGEPLRNNTGPLGITFGNGTTTCYGPPVPSIPRCICTRAPCP